MFITFFLLMETLDLRAHFTDWIQRYKIVYAVQLDPESLQSSFAIIPLGLGQARALTNTALYIPGCWKYMMINASSWVTN